MNEIIGTITIILMILWPSLHGFRNSKFLYTWIFDIKKIKENKQYYRFITSGFIHKDFGHLAFNLFSFFSFAQGIEIVLGEFILFLIFMVSMLTGNIYSFLYNKKKEQYFALGASGGVVGVIFASILLFQDSSVIIPFLPIPIPGYFYAVGYMIVSAVSLNKQNDNIGHDAHIGGALAGTVTCIALFPELLFSEYYLILGIFIPIAGIFVYNRIKEKKVNQ